MKPGESRSDARAGRVVLRAVPWLITLAAFGWIFATTDVDRMIDAVLGADWALFLGSMVALYFVLWVVDSAALRWLLARFHAPGMTLADVMPARGSTYMLGIVNYAAGTAAMALYFRRRFGIGIIEGGATLLIMMLADLAVLVVVVMLGIGVLPESVRAPVIGVGVAFAVGALAHLVFWRARWSWGPLERIRNLPQFRGFRDATVRDYVITCVLRSPMVVLYIAMHALTLRAFSIPVPLEKLLIYVPVQMFVAVLPISVGGLGTGQAVQRLLYAPYVGTDRALLSAGQVDPAIAIIDAYGLALFLGFVVPRVMIGLLTARAASRALADGAQPSDVASGTP